LYHLPCIKCMVYLVLLIQFMRKLGKHFVYDTVTVVSPIKF
jgi:hypothetical protein